MAEKRYWLVKSEPQDFSFDQLWAAKGRRTAWDGVRNHQARNFLRDSMRTGDGVLFYHSSCEPTGVVGICEVVREAYPDPTQFERGHAHFDEKSTPEEPTWVVVDLRAVRRLPRLISLEEIKRSPKLAGMGLVQRGNRLSIQPVRPSEWDEILRLGGL